MTPRSSDGNWLSDGICLKKGEIARLLHRNHMKEYYPEEESSIPMIEEYVFSDTHRDNFYERLMERRVQKIKWSKDQVIDDSIPFPIVPLHSAPTVLPTKRFNNTSDDPGINSSSTFSPTMSSNPFSHSPRTLH